MRSRFSMPTFVLGAIHAFPRYYYGTTTAVNSYGLINVRVQGFTIFKWLVMTNISFYQMDNANGQCSFIKVVFFSSTPHVRLGEF